MYLLTTHYTIQKSTLLYFPSSTPIFRFTSTTLFRTLVPFRFHIEIGNHGQQSESHLTQDSLTTSMELRSSNHRL